MVKKQDQEKIGQVHLYLTAKQKALLEERASEIGIPLSSYIKVRLFGNNDKE